MPSPRPASRVRRTAAIALVLAALIDAGWTLWWLPGATRDRVRTIDELPPVARPAIVLGCDLDARGEPGPALEARLRTALDVHRAGKATFLLVSGSEREAPAMRRWLEREGVPSSAIVADSSARRTHESLERAVAAFGLHRVLVVTSDFHLPRALWLAAHLGLDAEGVAAPPAPPGRRVLRRYLLREYLARNRAVLDVWFPPPPSVGPHDALPGQAVR